MLTYSKFTIKISKDGALLFKYMPSWVDWKNGHSIVHMKVKV